LANADLTQTSVSGVGTTFSEVFPSYSMSVVILSAPVVVPTIATPASATPNPVNGTQTSVSVLGADVAGASALTYTWSATGPAPVNFSPNGTNAAQNSTATFTKSGAYTLTVTVADTSGHSVQSSVSVTVNQTVTKLSITPASVTLTTGKIQQFTASATDQFGNALTITPTWAITGGGTLNSTGLFTASTPGGPYTLTATQAGVRNTAQVTVVAAVNSSTFVSQSVPSSMVAGQTYSVSVTYQNTGTTTWTSAAAYHLGTQDPSDNTTWLTGGGNRLLLPPGTSVAPGQSVTFTFNVKAPAKAGTYPMQWRTVQDGVQWFGAFTPIVNVSVTP
jgi:hypothetical protein